MQRRPYHRVMAFRTGCSLIKVDSMYQGAAIQTAKPAVRVDMAAGIAILCEHHNMCYQIGGARSAYSCY